VSEQILSGTQAQLGYTGLSCCVQPSME